MKKAVAVLFAMGLAVAGQAEVTAVQMQMLQVESHLLTIVKEEQAKREAVAGLWLATSLVGAGTWYAGEIDWLPSVWPLSRDQRQASLLGTAAAAGLAAVLVLTSNTSFEADALGVLALPRETELDEARFVVRGERALESVSARAQAAATGAILFDLAATMAGATTFVLANPNQSTDVKIGVVLASVAAFAVGAIVAATGVQVPTFEAVSYANWKYNEEWKARADQSPHVLPLSPGP